MAHIANLIIATDSAESALSSPLFPKTRPIEDDPWQAEEHVWRMFQPLESTAQSTSLPSRTFGDDDSLVSPSMTASLMREEPPRAVDTLSMTLKLKQKEPTLTRRRKISVPELGPMTTVQEMAMDSPTIPGRPPVHERAHERSHSDPTSSCRQQQDEPTEPVTSTADPSHLGKIGNADLCAESAQLSEVPVSSSCTQLPAASPPNAAADVHTTEVPLVMAPDRAQCLPQPLSIPIPVSSQPRSYTPAPSHDDTSPPEVPPKTRKPHESPHLTASPSTTTKSSSFSPISALSSALTATFSSSVTVPEPEGRSSPKPWSFGRTSPKLWSITGRSSPKISRPKPLEQQPNTPVLGLHPNKSEGCFDSGPSLQTSVPSYRRYESDDEAITRSVPHSRSKKQNHGLSASRNPPSRPTPSPIRPPTANSHMSVRGASPCPSPQQQSFLNLPMGHPPHLASQHYTPTELMQLQTQALAQIHRFHVLPSRDVESLSRELRALDERCEYLRNTHRSLRLGRQSLHDRICSYLRSPRVARFSPEALLKQEESLSELDRSIDSWVSKLEQAENRRMRVRQKLLEHVAAAAVMTIPSPAREEMSSKTSLTTSRPTGENTPPRSPRSPHSPPERYLKKHPARAPSPYLNDASPTRHAKLSNDDYAEGDVYELMEFVMDEVVRMGM